VFGSVHDVTWLSVAQVVQHIQMHVATLVPALLIGVVGGLLAALFTRLNTFICQRRALLLAKIPSRLLQRLVRMLETIALVVCIPVFLQASLGASPQKHTIPSPKRLQTVCSESFFSAGTMNYQ